MIVSDTAVKKSTSVVVLAFILIVAGVYSYLELPRENTPDVTIPYVFISTEYRGVSPADIETAITVEIEKKLKGIDGLKKISSISSEGLSSINVEFITGTDIDTAVQDVKDKVDQAKGSLPKDLDDDPSVFEINLSEMPVIVYSLSGTCGLPVLKELADDLQDKIEGVKGVLEAQVTGGLEREIRLEVFAEKLAYYGLSIGTLQQVVRSENTNTSGGNIQLGDGRFQLRVPGEFETPEEIYNLVIASHDGHPVYLKDVARVVDGFKEKTSIARLNGRDAVNISIKKRTGENILAMAKAVEDLIEKDSSSWPSGTEITRVMSQATDTKLMVADLENNILSGLVLVLIVIFFVMGLHNAILVSMAIPFSMLISFTILSILDVTLNMVVLFSLSLALGMLVDNAIVIVENCYRFMEQGIERKEAVMKATSEVAYPVIGSTLTTVAAFFPMIFWPGVMGEFMSSLPLTLIVTLSSSLFVALVINPAIASLLMRVKQGKQHSVSPLPFGPTEQPTQANTFVLRHYRTFLGNALGKPFTVILSAFCILILMVQSWLLVIGLEKPKEFLPDVDPNALYINTEIPEGTELDYIDRVLRRIEFAIAGYPEEDHPDQYGTERLEDISSLQALAPRAYTTPAGKEYTGPSDLKNIKNVYLRGVISSGSGSGFSENTPNHIGLRFIDLEDRGRSSKDTVADIRSRVEKIPGAKITIKVEEQGPPTGAPINIEIAGDNFAVLGEIAKRIEEVLKKQPHVEDVRDDFVEGIPSIKVTVDRQKAALFGLTTDMIGFALKSAYNGLQVSSFRDGDEDYDITVQLSEADRHMVDVLRELMLPTPSGQMVPLSTISSISLSGGLGNINRINNQRVVTVKANVDESKIPGPVARARAEELLADITLPPGYTITFTGEFEIEQETEGFLSKAFIIALLLIFLILVTMFNSVSQPFIIMTSVILSMGGAFLGLALFKTPFGIIMTGVGVISLAGVVVNNAIVLIDYTNQLRDRGMELREAVIAAGATRLRPVVLTAVTTILGLIPMITGISFDFHKGALSWASEASQWWQSMAVVVVFGLIVATFLTLFVVPTLYYLLEKAALALRTTRHRLTEIYWRPYPYLAGITKEKEKE